MAAGFDGRSGVRTLAALLATVLLGAVALTGCSAPARTQEPEPKRKPNVVVVMTDDQWLESMRVMPRTQHLIGDAGVTFDRNYASFPLCCPSRSTFLSGQFAHNNGVRHNYPPQGGYLNLDEQDTLPVWMQRAGYTTSHIGKYPNGYGYRDETEVPPGWDEWRGSVDPTTYRMWGYRLNENGKLHTYGRPHVEDPELYQTDVYRDKGADFIARHATSRKPFFLSMAFLAPHSENTGVGPAPRPAPRHEGAFADEPLPSGPAFNEKDLGDKPSFLQRRPRLDTADRSRLTESYRGRLASLRAVDEAVQKLVDTLRATGQLDNTYVLFTSDNGFFFGQHRVHTGKYLPHEASAHVPMLIRGPGLPAGRHSRELTGNADLTATIAEIARAEPGHALDGRSLLPFAEHPQRRTTRPVLHEAATGAQPDALKADSERGLEGASGRAAAEGNLDQEGTAWSRVETDEQEKGEITSASYEAIRTDRYLYIRYASGDRELYDLRTDPHELTSRHDDPRYTAPRRFLDRQLDELQDCRGEECRTDISPAPAPT
ncbi:arylsulfatase A-like enzyme [Prauserella isguenensis]|uniref:Arylsulfatase A-like enzyme n=1 Tax=Prauserella isguenensis TaxID=1470180 RepID=A0A839RXI5_9PSEU|nr:sulfatase [Prauserella isguenensis]MBB3049550.1 arylsulfatase A-like enzyme [Prauserella isguenensis]